MINNVSHKKRWNTGTVQVHAEPPPIPLIKIKNGDKSDKDFVKIKLRRDPKSEKSDLYELKWTSLITASLGISCYLFATST